ncbi:hypothetical protein J6590_106613, partial [Homalodisca vitripennis]
MASMTKKGRPSTFPVDETRRLISTHRDKIVVDGNVVGKKNHIWNDISNAINAIPELKTSVSASNIYLVVKENRCGLLSTLLHPNGSTSSVDSANEEQISSSSNEEEVSANSSSDEFAEEVKKFKITLSREDWNDMRPEHATYKDGKT